MLQTGREGKLADGHGLGDSSEDIELARTHRFIEQVVAEGVCHQAHQRCTGRQHTRRGRRTASRPVLQDEDRADGRGALMKTVAMLQQVEAMARLFAYGMGLPSVGIRSTRAEAIEEARRVMGR